MASSTRPRVAYFYDADISKYIIAPAHPMKPHRIELTHTLVGAYGLYKKMKVYTSKKADANHMYAFHSKPYVNFLKNVKKTDANDDKNINKLTEERKQKFRLTLDCPVFDGIFDYCATYTGASLEGASHLNRKDHDIVINWSGGLHHAKRESASGFCYINDIVLAIMELLKTHSRVLYIDIDVHHGDAVQEAFYKTDRVMTCSFHKYGEQYFPMSGDIDEKGVEAGLHYSINVPMKEGCNDEMYQLIFEPVVRSVISVYSPDAIVLQCGADSLAEDRIGVFNLTVQGHGRCVDFVKKFNIPMLVLGGGGYTPRNVARCWTYETAVCLGEKIPNEIPLTYGFIEQFGPNFDLNYVTENKDLIKENKNSKKELLDIQTLIQGLLKKVDPVPSVQMQEIPGPFFESDDEDDDEDPDVRYGERQQMQNVEHPGEYFDNEEESAGCSSSHDRRPYDSDYSTQSSNSNVPSEDASNSGSSTPSEIKELNQMHIASSMPPLCDDDATTSKSIHAKENSKKQYSTNSRISVQSDDNDARKRQKKFNTPRYQLHLKLKAAKQGNDNKTPGSEDLDQSYESSSEDEDDSSNGSEVSEDESDDEENDESDDSSKNESGDEERHGYK